MLPRKMEIKTSQLEWKIILRDTIEAICPTCKHELRIRKDDHVHCIGCLMKGKISVLVPKIIKKNKTDTTRRNSKVTTYKMDECQTKPHIASELNGYR